MWANRPYDHQALKACQAPSAIRIPAKTWLIGRGLILFARIPPAMPPKNRPGISRNPVFHDTNPCFEYAISANSPVGGISATREVPCARCWLKANSSTSSGTRNTPPPMPNIPEATPQTLAIVKMPAPRLILSATGGLPGFAGGAALELRLSQEQNSRQHEETTEHSFQVPGRQGECDQAPCISAEWHSERAQNPSVQIHL